jgi:hypothetical protein
MKPRSIANFQRLLLFSSLLTVANILIHYAALRSAALANGTSPAGPILGVLIAVGFYTLFRIGIGNLASNIAKWLFVALTAFSLITVPSNLTKVMDVGLSYTLLDCVCFLLQLAATMMLFRKDAKAWLKSEHSSAQRT